MVWCTNSVAVRIRGLIIHQATGLTMNGEHSSMRSYLARPSKHQEFDFLVVDEGQDLGREGFEFLRLFLEKQADILWLEDLHQNLGQSLGRPFDNEGFVGLTLNRNYRSPLSIQSLIDQVFPGRALPGNAMHGLGVGTIWLPKARCTNLYSRRLGSKTLGFWSVRW